MKRFVCTILSVALCFLSLHAQNAFVDYQKSFLKVSDVFKRKEDTLKKQFAAKKLQWPARYVFFRSFKFDSELEVWVKDKPEEAYQLFKTYKVCALAGTMGPKRIEGDFQVPEGFYYINEFNPNSVYHLSLGLNYPNAADRIQADSLQPGGDIYIHGSCVTIGCIPVTNPQIEELYILASHARGMGEDFIPVHIYPIRFNNPKSAAYLEKVIKDDQDLKNFEKSLKQVYDYFEVTRQLPIVGINTNGEYVVY